MNYGIIRLYSWTGKQLEYMIESLCLISMINIKLKSC